MSFRVPNVYRLRHHPVLGSTDADGRNGMFLLPSPEPGWMLAALASDGDDPDVPEAAGWEHVSVHAYKPTTHKVERQRTPTWKEMCAAKDMFWDDEDVVMQLHPRRSEYVNLHPHVLHLWRSRTRAIPEPPALLVGPKTDAVSA